MNALDEGVEDLPPLNPLDEGVEDLPSLEEEGAQRDNQLRTTFDAALRSQPDRKAGVLELARKTRAPSDVIETRFDDFQKTWEAAQFDPKAWREANPELAKIALEHPELGEVVVKDQPLSAVSQLKNLSIDAKAFVGERLGLDKVENALGFNPLGYLTPTNAPEQMFDVAKELVTGRKTAAERREGEREKTQQVGVVQDETTARYHDLEAAFPITAPIVRTVERYRETAAQMEVSKQQFRLLTMRQANAENALREKAGLPRVIGGGDTYELEKKILDAKRLAVRRDYGEGAGGQVLTDVAESMASNVAVLNEGGIAAAAGAVIGGVAGALITRSPAGAGRAALKGASILGQAGVAYGSLQLEAGDMYGQLLDAKTDKGQKLSEEEARGGALLYGALAAGVELASMRMTLRAMGPLGKALLSGSGKAAMADLVARDAGLRGIAARAGAEWAKSAAGEGGEEFVQSILEDVVSYLARSKAGGELQAGPVADIAKAKQAAEKGFIGGALGLGTIEFGTSTVTHALARDRAVMAGRQVATIAGLKDSPTVRAAPEEVARMIEHATAQTGEPVTHVYVDPQAFTKLFQSENADPGAAATALLGPDGPQQLQAAIVSGGKLEVPVADYLEKWGSTDAAHRLVEDTTTRAGHLTPRQLQERAKEIDQRAQEIAKEVEAAEPAGTEADFVEALEQQLVATGRAGNAKDARAAANMWRALVRTQAEVFGQDANELFQGLTVHVQQGETITPGALQQAVNPALLEQMRQHFAGLKDKGVAQQEAYYTDPNTGLLNERGFEVLPRDPARPHLAEFEVEGGKFFNDAHGHKALDGALRIMAGALTVAGIQDGAKVKGGLQAWVKDEAEAGKLAETLQEAVSKANAGGRPIRVTPGAAARQAAAKDLGQRKGAPLAFLEGDEAAFNFEAKDVDKAKAKEILGRAAARSKAMGEALKGAAARAPVALHPAHLAAFETKREGAFDAIYLEPSGLLTEAGFALAQEFDEQPFSASADMRGLRPLNEAFGRDGSEVVLTAFKRQLAGIAEQLGVSAAYLHGDEFAAQGTKEQLQALFGAAETALKRVGFFEKLADGGFLVQEGIHFAHGIGPDFDTADRVELPLAKERQGDVPGPRRVEALEDVEGDLELVDVREAARRDDARGSREAAAEEVVGDLGYGVEKKHFAGEDEPGGPRGYVEIARKGLERIFRVGLTKKADLSTFLHESGHVFLELLGDLAEREDAPDRVKNDWATALKYMGVRPSGVRVTALGVGAFGLEALRSAAMAGGGNLTPAQVVNAAVKDLRRGVEEGNASPAHLATQQEAIDQLRAIDLGSLKLEPTRLRHDIETEHHEKWARSFEAYLLEGKAPSAKLVRVFTRFKLWLTRIYRQALSLNVDLNDEIRGVFDRLLATDAEIQRTKRAMGLKPVFSSPAEAGMSPEQWRTYLEDQEEATSGAARSAEHHALKDRLRETEAWWKQELKTVREDLEQEYDGRPDVRASSYIRAGKWVTDDGRTISNRDLGRLDRAAVEEIMGPAAAKKAFGTRLVDEGGEHPDDVAELFGFPTGAEMLRAVSAVPEREGWLDETAESQMRRVHPDVLQDREKLRDEIARGLHGEQTETWLLKEWAKLRERAYVLAENPEANKVQAVPKERLGLPPPPIESIKKAAKLLVERRAAGRLDPGVALQAERAAADKAARAVARKDYAQAAVFKQQQLLNLYLHRELTAARDERDAFLELAADLSKDKARARLGKGHPRYRDGVDLLLEAFGLKAPSPRESALPGLDQVVDQMDADGATVGFDRDVVGALLEDPKPWKALTVAEIRAVRDAVKNIRGAATAKATVLIEGKRLDKELVIADLLTEARKNLESRGPLPSSVSAETTSQTIARGWNAFSGALLKPEVMVDWLAGGDLKSTWFRAVVKPLQEAKAREVDLLNGTIKPILDAFEKIPAEVRRRSQDKIDGKTLFPNHAVSSEQLLEAPSRRFELLMLALNAGNESNLVRLLEGRNITEGQVRTAIDLLTKEELDWVQSVWDAAESLWPEARALEERDSGLAPPKLDRRPLVTRHGTYAGGYFPAIYDRRVEAAGERQVANQIASLLDPRHTRPGTSHSHLKRRVEGFTGVLSLEPTAISSHLAQTAHDIAFREAVKSVGGLILAPEIQAALKDRLGNGRAAKFLEWVKDVGQMRGVEGFAHAGALMTLTRKLRGNTVIAALGFSIPNAIEDLSNLPAAVARTDLKAKHLAGALGSFAASPVETLAFTEEKSGELRTRRDQLQRELAKEIRTLTAKGPFARGPMRWIQDHAFVFMEWSDKATSTPVWLGAYRQALEAGETDGDAITYADRIVRQVFPSHSPVDQAAILRDKGFIGTSLMFYGFLSTYYNGIADLTHLFGKADTAKEKAQRAGQLLGYVLAVSVLSEFLRGRGPEKDEDWETWFLRKTLAGGLTALPGGGDLANAIEGGYLKKQTNPRVVSIVSIGAAVAKAATELAGAEDDPKKLEAFLRSLAPIVGLPEAQPLRTYKYLRDVATGESEPEGPTDVVGGVIYGEKESRPLNPATAAGQLLE